MLRSSLRRGSGIRVRGPLHRLAGAFAFGLALSLATAHAHAQAAPKDADAEKALQEAMGTDYLETNFDRAESRLRAAIDACGADGCSAKLKARLYMALGTVLAHGKKQLEDARDAFVEALGLDPETKPDPDLLSAEISFAFEQARAAFGLAGVKSGLDVKPPPEQRVRTPLPVYAEIRADLLERTKQVTLWYQPPGGGEHRSLLMKKLRDRGYGILIPCTDLRAVGTVRYYLLATDADGAILASAGSRDQPLTTSIKASISTPPPSWPGFAPPQTCGALEKEKPSQCLDDRQCSEGLTCVAGACVPRKEGPPAKDVRKNWVSLAFWPDVSMFSGEGVCSLDGQDKQHYVCLRQDGSRYDGVPTANAANNVNLGFALGTLRVALAYDRLLLDNVGAGARVGFAFNGASGGGASFLPVHVEVRGQYYLLPRALEGTGVRPYGQVSAGLAQIDTRVEVEILEDAAACGADTSNLQSPCTRPSGASGVIEERSQILDAYKQAGLGFASLGAGVMYEPAAGMAMNLALRASVTFPVVTAVLSPELGFALGF